MRVSRWFGVVSGVALLATSLSGVSDALAAGVEPSDTIELASLSASDDSTIDGLIQGVGAIGPGQTLTIPVLGRAGIPTDGVGGVALNVTVTSPTAPSYLTVFPTGQTRPLASNLNFSPGQTIPNSVIAQVGDDGSISVYNNAGSTHVIVDISGWFPDAGSFTAVPPARIADTRNGESTIDGISQRVGAIGPGQTLRIPVLGRAGIPNDVALVGGVTLNVTATSPTAPSYLTVFPTGQTRPLASNLNFTPGQTIPNSVIAQVGDDGSISVFNHAGNTHVLVDISGWFPTINSLTSVSPARLADTRPGNATIDGATQGVGAIGPGQTLRIPVLGRAGIPNDGVGGVTLNVTATSPTAPSYLTVFPTGQTRPLASNLNFTPGQTIPNSVIAQVGDDGSISVFNHAGNTHVLVDISGWFPATNSFTAVPPARIADTRNSGTHLTARVEELLRSLPGEYAVSVIPPGGQQVTASIRGGSMQEPASVMKLFVAYAILDRVDRGVIALDTLTRSDVSVRDCLRVVLHVSDNYCHWDLVAMIGNQNLNDQFAAEGYTRTVYQGYSQSGAYYSSKHTTTDDVALLLSRLHRGELLSPAMTDLFREHLETQVWRHRIPSGAPTGTPIANKTGYLWVSTGFIHADSAIVTSPAGTYVVTVIGSRNATAEGVRAIGRTVYEYYNGPISSTASFSAANLVTTSTVTAYRYAGNTPVTTIPSGTRVEAYASARTWYQVLYNGSYVYVHNSHLRNYYDYPRS